MNRTPHWADALLDQVESGLDVTQIDERLALTPEQRLDRLQAFLEFLDGFERLPPGAPRL